MKKLLIAGVTVIMLFFMAHTSSAEEKYIASKNSDKYHKPECSVTKKISNDNLIILSSEDEAKKAGYKVCKNCFGTNGQ